MVTKSQILLMWCLPTVIFQENAKFQLEAKKIKVYFFPLLVKFMDPCMLSFFPPLVHFLQRCFERLSF